MLKFQTGQLFIADASLNDESDTLVGRGGGNFRRSRIALMPEIGYQGVEEE